MFKHPQKVCMTYYSHLKFSLYLSFKFAEASVKALIHGLYPDIYISNSTDAVKYIQSEINKKGCRN